MWKQYITPVEFSVLASVDDVRDWLVADGVKAKAEPSENGVAVTTNEGQRTVYSLPVPVTTLRWSLGLSQ